MYTRATYQSEKYKNLQKQLFQIRSESTDLSAIAKICPICQPICHIIFCDTDVIIRGKSFVVRLWMLYIKNYK